MFVPFSFSYLVGRCPVESSPLVPFILTPEPPTHPIPWPWYRNLTVHPFVFPSHTDRRPEPFFVMLTTLSHPPSLPPFATAPSAWTAFYFMCVLCMLCFGVYVCFGGRVCVWCTCACMCVSMKLLYVDVYTVCVYVCLGVLPWLVLTCNNTYASIEWWRTTLGLCLLPSRTAPCRPTTAAATCSGESSGGPCATVRRSSRRLRGSSRRWCRVLLLSSVSPCSCLYVMFSLFRLNHHAHV